MGDRWQLLIVDDDADIVDELVECLSFEGYTCYGTTSPAQAGELFRQHPGIGIVITDLRMPQEDGLSLLNRLREQSRGQRLLEAIVFTGHGSEEKVIEALRHGVSDYQKKPVDIDRLFEGVRRAERRLNEQAELLKQALRDPLTDLFNRRYLDETLVRELARAEREQRPLSIALVDVDHFKRFNDQHGHAAGDRMLQALAKVLREDTRTGDVACRYGGEEFVVVMPGTWADAALARMEHWRRTFGGLRLQHEGECLQGTLSAGVACYPAHGSTPQQVLEAADRALYAAKAAGRDRSCAAAEPPSEPVPISHG